jgi:hypothetical protein
VGLVIGGDHNAGHETLFDLMTTGQPVWSWDTFAGGAAQAIARPVGILAGGGARMAFGLPLPAENLLAGAFGRVTPSMLNDIVRAPAEPPAAGPASVLAQAARSKAGPEPGAGPGEPDAVTGPAPGGTTLSWLGDPAAVGMARSVLVKMESPADLRPRRAVAARIDLALALARAGEPDEATGVALEAITSPYLVPSNYWRADEVIAAVEPGDPQGAETVREAITAGRDAR